MIAIVKNTHDNGNHEALGWLADALGLGSEGDGGWTERLNIRLGLSLDEGAIAL